MDLKMKGSFKAELRVNKSSIKLNSFVEEFLARTTLGAASSLKGAENIQSLEIHQEEGNIRVIVNGNELILTPFPSEIISNTLTGLVSSLGGVEDIDSLDISIKGE